MYLPPIHVPAGTPTVQSKGVETERIQEEINTQRREVFHGKKAEAAGGIGEPDGEDHETAERDGDGRRPWEETQLPTLERSSPRTSKDPSNQSGKFLDLLG